MMKSKNLVQSWLHVELVENKRTLTDVLQELNKIFKTNCTHSRVRQWENNRHGRGLRLPMELRIYIAKKAVRSVLRAARINTENLSQYTINKIVERLE